MTQRMAEEFKGSRRDAGTQGRSKKADIEWILNLCVSSMEIVEWIKRQF